MLKFCHLVTTVLTISFATFNNSSFREVLTSNVQRLYSNVSISYADAHLSFERHVHENHFACDNDEFEVEPKLPNKSDSYYRLSSGNFSQVNSTSVSSNFMKNYFYNLNTNMTNNDTGGICSYVALEMLLSFYEVNISTLTVNDSCMTKVSGSSVSALKSNSPGATPFPFLPALIANSANLFIFNMPSMNYVLPKLLKASDDLGLYGREEHVLELNDNEMWVVLGKYLQLYGSSLSYSIAHYSHSDANSTESQRIQFIINEIDANRPVIVGLYDNSTSTTIGHACIAYDYSVDNYGNYTLFYNCGWKGSGKTHAVINSSFFISEVVSLNVSSSHSHSYSYLLNNSNTCSCEFYSSHPNHSHSHTYDYVAFSDLQHFAYCMCGSKVKQFHEFAILPDMTSYCSRCGATI